MDFLRYMNTGYVLFVVVFTQVQVLMDLHFLIKIVAALIICFAWAKFQDSLEYAKEYNGEIPDFIKKMPENESNTIMLIIADSMNLLVFSLSTMTLFEIVNVKEKLLEPTFTISLVVSVVLISFVFHILTTYKETSFVSEKNY